MATSSTAGPPLRLLMPTVRSPIPHAVSSLHFSLSARSPRIKPMTGRLSGVRSRSGSVAATADRSGPSAFPVTWGAEETEGLDGERWIGRKCRFEIVVERMELAGYQMYAVEKWMVERTRPVTVLAVYTGDPSHKIVVTALSPASNLTPAEAQSEFNAAVQHLRKQDGARPRETPKGTLMVTSLAHFRSDYTIVQIPNGDFLAAQDRLYANINLLRMGCSGRSAVTLEEPSDTTKDRFKSTYFFHDGLPPPSAFRTRSHSRTHTRTHSQPVTMLSPTVPEASPFPSSVSHQTNKNNNTINPNQPNPAQTGAGAVAGVSRHPHFTAYVLELVKLLQASLAMCGMFPLPPPHTLGPMSDGLLCDMTIEGLRKWVTEVGEGLIGFEPTERIADPSVVAVLLSFILSARNKLASFVPVVTKDPFLHPHEFLHSLTSYVHSQASTNNSTQTLPVPTIPQPTTQPGHLSPSSASGSVSMTTSPLIPHQSFPPQITFSAPTSPLYPLTSLQSHVPSHPLIPVPIIYLTLALHTSLLSQHDARIRHSDSRKVHRVILSKLDPTSDSDVTDEERKWLGGRVMGLVGRVSVSGMSGPGSVGAPTADLGAFIREITSGRDRDRDKDKEKDKEVEKERDRERPSRDGESGKERGDNGVEKERVGGSVRALWTGKVEVLVRMRERVEGTGWVFRGIEREREADRGIERDKDRLTSSDVEDVSKVLGEDDMAFAGAWSGKVQKRLEMWTGINRSKRSVDLSTTPIKSVGRTSVAIPLSTQSSSSGHVYPASELKGLGVPAVILSHENGDEDELLSSGQVSPISISRTHNPFTLGASPDISSANLAGPEHDRRLSSAAVSPERSGNAEAGERAAKWEHIIGRREAWWKGHVLEDELMKSESKARRRQIRRRYTFHDLHSVRGVPVLRMDRLRIDVELCGQILMMRRREAHLEGVVKCLEYLTMHLAHASNALRATHTAHKPIIDALTSPISNQHSLAHLGAPTSPTTSAMATISPTSPTSSLHAFHASTPPALTPVMAALHALPVPPPVPALEYEAAQLRVDDMWASTREARRKLWELRSAVFGRDDVLGVSGSGSSAGVGTRGRRKGRRRRTSQWRLDGRECPVDALGRTESEAEEERAIVADGGFSDGEYETESEAEFGVERKDGLGDSGGDEGEREAMGPMWLLRVFTSWGARLGFIKGEAEVGAGVGPNVPATGPPSPGEVVGNGNVGAGTDGA